MCPYNVSQVTQLPFFALQGGGKRACGERLVGGRESLSTITLIPPT